MIRERARRLKIQRAIGYRFKDYTLLELALTHSSYANESRISNHAFNERLEFLGDSVLSLSISRELYCEYPDEPEGNLSKLRSGLVRENALSQIARSIRLGDFLLLGKGEELTGGRNRNSILADAVEALCGAVFLDSNFKTAHEFIIGLYEKANINIKNKDIPSDYKSSLQQKVRNRDLIYSLHHTEGPDHDPMFFMEVWLDNTMLGRGKGKNKKSAEQMAAKDALEKLS